MGRIHLLFYALILTTTAALQVSAHTMSWFTQTPGNASLLEGDSVVLHCQLDIRIIMEHGEYRVTWSKNNERLNFTDPEHSNYWLTGDPHSAQYYLLISDADLTNSGVFACAVYENIGTESGDDLWVLRNVTTAVIQVFVRPPPPECHKTDLNAGANRTRSDINYVGDLIELTCTGYISHPSFTLELTWKDRVITEANGTWIHIDQYPIRQRAYRITADNRHNGASFQCSLTSTEFPDFNETCKMVALNIFQPNPTQPKVTVSPKATQTPPSTLALSTQPKVEPVTKTTPTKDNQGIYNSHTALTTPVIAILAILPIIIILILVLVLVFLYKAVKLSTKRRDDEIRVVYRDGTSTVIDRRTHGGHRGNLNVTLEPAALTHQGSVVPTDMEPGAYSVPPPYSELLSVLDDTVANGGLHPSGYDEKKDSHMYVDMVDQL